MTASDLVALSPLILLSATALVVMLSIAIRRHHGASATLALLGLAASFASLRWAASVTPRQVTGLLLIDGYTLFYWGVLLALAAAVVLLAYSYLEHQTGHQEEFYCLMLLATAGGLVLVASSHMASLFLGFEILSVSLYALIAYLHLQRLPLEAGVKYLVLAATSSAFLLFGMALLYSETGSMQLATLARFYMGAPNAALGAAGWAGTVLMLTGIGFKLAVVPFHLWTPDVYQGAPLPTTALVATISKGSVFALLLRWFHPAGSLAGTPVWWAFVIMAAASMLAGNLLALRQNNVKRLLAYSSIAHMGYLMVAFVAAGPLAVQAATYYLLAYVITILGAFGIMSVLCSGEEECCELEDYRGLFWQRPVLAAMFSAMLLSLAGIPLTAGFLGKFYVMAAGASSALWLLLFVLVASSTIGLYYYLRVLVVLFSSLPEDHVKVMLPRGRVPAGAGFSLAVLVILLFVFGLYPAPLWDLIRGISAGIG
ncbi:MAG TPA: NADH-quinone oxidoreductase subunit N [Solibacterales bacterium]|nr:NADH-quinone oxidoreductase subunit N [Bryobacterales bacterium]